MAGAEVAPTASQQPNGNLQAATGEEGPNPQSIPSAIPSSGPNAQPQGLDKNAQGQAIFGGAPGQPGNAVAKTAAPGPDAKNSAGKSQGNQHPGHIQKQPSGVSLGGKPTSAADPLAPGQPPVGHMLGEQQPNAFAQYGMPVPGGQPYPFHPGMMAMTYP